VQTRLRVRSNFCVSTQCARDASTLRSVDRAGSIVDGAQGERRQVSVRTVRFRAAGVGSRELNFEREVWCPVLQHTRDASTRVLGVRG
jgi:hypothetical protein